MNSSSRRSATKYLTDNQVVCWGAVGGLAAYLAKYVVLDPVKLSEMISGSRPVAQVVTVVVIAVVAALIGGVWAFAHRPLRKELVAIQLGVIAPAAVIAMALPAAAANTGEKIGGRSFLLPDTHIVPETEESSETPASPSFPFVPLGATTVWAQSNTPPTSIPVSPGNPQTPGIPETPGSSHGSTLPPVAPGSNPPKNPDRPSIWTCILDAIYNIPC